MKRWLFRPICLLVFMSLSAPAFAEFHLASGLGGAWNISDDYGEDPYFRFRGELPIYAYLPISKPFWLRGGLRLANSEDQPEMPGAIKIEETDFGYTFEAAAVFDWFVMPSVGFGYGVINRRIKLKTSDKLTVEDQKISGSETLNFWQTQVGLGIPFLDGFVVMEPFFRYWNIKSDNRSNWNIGFDITLQVL